MYEDALERDDPIGALLDATPKPSLDGRMMGVHIGIVTENRDPLKQNRIKVELQIFDDENEARLETDWLSQGVFQSGPHDAKRQVIYGFDPPVPELGSRVGIVFNGGDPHDGYYIFQPRYGENRHQAPALEKDTEIDRSLRYTSQGGFDFGIDTEGNVVMTVPGSLTIRAVGGVSITSCKSVALLAPDVEAVGVAVLRLIGTVIDKTEYPRPDEWARIRELAIEAFKAARPGAPDPGIEPPETLED